ncbi:MAG: hypothetical protein AAB370_00125 [Verrucomicrobiota bacterium]
MKTRNHFFFVRLGALLSVVLVALGGAGCRSAGKPASASFASVVISDRSAVQILDTTIAVFREDGYTPLASGRELIFDKEGSRLNTLSRDGLVATQAGAVTVVRVKVELIELGPSSQRLQAHAFMVSGAGDSFFEDEHKLADFRGRPYQRLLDEVAKRLK